MPAEENPPAPAERRSTEWAHARIRERIIDGSLPAGKPVSQAALASDLGVSRTPLREATRLLQNEGLLEGEPNRRLRVASVSPEDLDEIYAQRIALECVAVRVTALVSDQSLVGHLEQALDCLDSAALDGRTEDANAAHRDFHLSLIKPAGERFSRLSETLWDHTIRYRAAYFETFANTAEVLLGAQADHHRILDAVRSNDATAACDELAAHYSKTAEVLLRQLDESYEPRRLIAAVGSVCP